MHVFDPNGSIHAYRLQRERRARIQGIVAGFLVVLGAAGLAALVFIGLSLRGN